MNNTRPNDLASQKFSHDQCIHGNCLDHEPEWEKVGSKHLLKLNKKIFLRKSECCGAPMTQCKKMQTLQCKKCGCKKDYIESIPDDSELALCLCCGKTENMFYEDCFDF